MTANNIQTVTIKNCDLVYRKKQEFGQSSLKLKKFFRNKICVCKLKFKFNYEANQLLNDFPFQRINFSKYEKGFYCLKFLKTLK